MTTRAAARLLAAARVLRAAVPRVAAVARTVLGAPDYERYLAHQRSHHAGAVPMSRDEFVRDSQRARYERPGARCC